MLKKKGKIQKQTTIGTSNRTLFYFTGIEKIVDWFEKAMLDDLKLREGRRVVTSEHHYINLLVEIKNLKIKKNYNIWKWNVNDKAITTGY